MRILQVASGDLWAGAEVQFFYLCRQLRRAGADVHVILFNEGVLAQRLRDDDVKTRVLPESEMNILQVCAALRAHLCQLAPDIIHTHRYKENILVSLVNAVSTRAASVRTVHGGQEIHAPWWKISRHLVNALDHFCGARLQQGAIAVSDLLGQELTHSFGAKHIHVIENAIDVDYVETLSAREPEIAIDSGRFNLAIIGRLVPVKRHDLLLQALQQLGSSTCWHLYIIGEGPMREAIMKQVAAMGLQSRVTFTGAMNPVYPLMRKMDLLVMPSDHEGLPMTLLEAMALRVPVVAHAVGGIPVVTRGEELADLVYKHEPPAYAQVIDQLMRDGTLHKKKVERAYTHVRERYDVSQKVHAFLQLYAQLQCQRQEIGRRQ